MGNRKTSRTLLLLAVLMWTIAGVRIAVADTGREPGDPRIPAYVSSSPGPFTGSGQLGSEERTSKFGEGFEALKGTLGHLS